MNIEYLREVLVLSECLSISEAASRLYMTQSCLSRHISSVERELGVTLFTRTHCGVTLTDAGKTVVDGFKIADESIQNAVAVARGLDYAADEVVRVAGCLSNEHVGIILSEALDYLSSPAMPVAIRLIDTRTRNYVSLLLDHTCDVAVAPRYCTSEDDKLAFVHLAEIPYAITCDKRHFLAKKETICIDDLKDCSVFTYPLEGRSDYHGYVDKALMLERRGIELRYVSDVELSVIGNPENDVLFGLSQPNVSKQSLNLVTRAIDCDRAFDLCVAVRQEDALQQPIDSIVSAFLDAAKASWVIEAREGIFRKLGKNVS